MKPSRRDFVAAAGAASSSDLANADEPDQDHDHDHDHQVVPSDPTLRVKALESLLVEKGLVDPGGVLREFGLELSENVEVRVWDSTAELRYLVLPERPAGSEKLSEEELAALVTRDAMIGVAKVTIPKPGGAA